MVELRGPARTGKSGVLIIGPLPPPYHGVSTATAALCVVLERNGINYTLLDIADRRGLTNIGRVDWGNISLALTHGTRFVYALIRQRPAVVLVPISQNTWGVLRDWLFLIPARLTRRRIVIHLHGSDFRHFHDRSPGLMRAVTRWILRGTARVIVLGECLRPIFAGLVPAERVVVIPNGVDDRTLAEVSPMDRPAGAGDVRVTFLGSLMKAKGFLDVLKATPAVLEAVPNVRFVLAGGVVNPEDIREAERFLAATVSRARIDLPGVVTGADKARLLRSSDIFVFPPREPEGLPLVILEAMAAGLPVITTDQGAIREVVVDGVTGFVVPAGETLAIVARVVQLARDGVLRRRMGHASRQRFQERYRLERWGADMVRLLAELIPADQTPAGREPDGV